MASLFHSLNVGAEALYATRQGVDTSSHNIANAQTEGYSRQRVNLKQRDPLDLRNLQIGNGVYVGSITRSHDSFIEKQINKANQEGGRARARADGMKALEIVFSPEMSASIGDEMSNFFNAMQDLANFPEDYTVRTGVVESAKNLAVAIRRTDQDLKDNRSAFNERVLETTDKLNQNLSEIASLNIKIQTAEAGGGNPANDLRDQRDRLVRDVTGMIDVNYYEDQHGMMVIRGPKEVTLVDAGHSSILAVERSGDNGGMFDVTITDWEQHSKRNLTSAIHGGSLGAYLQMRDVDVPALIDSNNKLAHTIASQVNGVHQQGFGLKDYAEVTGRNFFRAPADLNSAAVDFDLDDAIIESNDAIAAGSSPLAPGDNVIVNQIVKLKEQRFFEGDATLNEFYANYVGALGLDVLRSQHVKEANDILGEDLNKRREGVSGVSLDEEATNLLKWQTCFTANSKVITTVDEMLETVLSLKR